MFCYTNYNKSKLVANTSNLLKLEILSALPNLFFTMRASSLGLDTIVLKQKSHSKFLLNSS